MTETNMQLNPTGNKLASAQNENSESKKQPVKSVKSAVASSATPIVSNTHSLDKDKIVELLRDFPQEHAERFAAYCIRLKLEKDKQGKPKNPFMERKTSEEVAGLFRRVYADGLVFDGIHVTLQSTGISYDYIAYKNKMLKAYPESKIDVALVYKGDEFTFKKESGSVEYTHVITNPFDQKDDDLIGGYCIIKNNRGEFITLLSSADLEKHRKVAKTDYIWREWYKEMCMKTVVKKACRQHFADVYETIEEADNENYDLDNPLEVELEWKKEVEAISSVEELKAYWQKHQGRGKGFGKLIQMRKEQLSK